MHNENNLANRSRRGSKTYSLFFVFTEIKALFLSEVVALKLYVQKLLEFVRSRKWTAVGLDKRVFAARIHDARASAKPKTIRYSFFECRAIVMLKF